MGHPDFASLKVKYVPDKIPWYPDPSQCVCSLAETRGVFQEHVVNTTMDDLIRMLNPDYYLDIVVFNRRGGIGITSEKEKVKNKAAKESLIRNGKGRVYAEIN